MKSDTFLTKRFIKNVAIKSNDSNNLFFLNKENCKIIEEVFEYGEFTGIYREYSIQVPLTLQVEHAKGFLKFQYELTGFSKFTPDCDSGIPVLIEDGQFNGIYMPYIKGQVHYVRSRKCFDLMLSLEYLKSIIGDNVSPLARFLSSIELCQPALLMDIARNIPPLIQRCIQDIIYCDIVEPFKDQYLKNKYKELVLLTINYSCNNCNRAGVMDALSDHEKIYSLKQYIDQHLDEIYTLQSLAEKAAMSQTKLKGLFKRLVKMSIMAYVRDKKMECAYSMLTEKDHSVNEVAAYLNYEYSHHFSTAFKRKYGIVPSEAGNKLFCKKYRDA